jgi:MFS family permease
LVKTHVEESLGANPGDAALNPADSVAMGVPAAEVPVTPADPRAGTFRALEHRAFRLLFAAFLINQTGFWISHISLQGLMVELTDNDTRQNGLLFFALFVPAFLLAPLAGVAADQFDRKRIVIACYGIVCVASGCLAWTTQTGVISPHLILVIAFGMGVSFAFSGPASLAIAANSVPRDDLASAVALQSAANNLTRVLGPLLCAPLLVTGRFEISFALYLGAALIAACLTFAMRIERYPPDTEDGGIWSRMRSGFTHARERHPCLPALSTVAVLSLFGVSHTVLIPSYAQEILGSRDYFAWLVAATGIGAVAGALQTGRSKRAPRLASASVALFIYGLMMLTFGLTSNLALALVCQAAVGFFYFTVMTLLQTLIQQIVDESKRGRVMSLFQVSWAGLVPFGSLAMGFLAESVGVSSVLVAGGCICAVYGAGMAITARRWSPQSSG